MGTYFIGDIHGEREKLESLLKVVEKNDKNPKYIFLGDYVDRGPDSAGVLSILMDLHKDGHICVAGNHDYMMVDGWKGHLDQVRLWDINGGGQTKASYDGKEGILEAHIEWVRTLPLWYETDDFYASHAPVGVQYLTPELAQTVHYNSRESLCWYYNEPEGQIEFDMISKRGKIGVCGHIHALARGINGPRFYPHYWYVDGGCGCHRTGNLIAACLEDRVWYNQTGHSEPIVERSETWVDWDNFRVMFYS